MGQDIGGGQHPCIRSPPPSLLQADLGAPPDSADGPRWSVTLASFPACEFSHHPAPAPPESLHFSPPTPTLPRTPPPPQGVWTPSGHTGPLGRALSPAGHCPFNRFPQPGAVRLGSKFLPVIRSRERRRRRSLLMFSLFSGIDVCWHRLALSCVSVSVCARVCAHVGVCVCAGGGGCARVCARARV